MRISMCGIVLAAVMAWGGQATAHHSSSMFDVTPVWVDGAVVRFDRINPHTLITLEERDRNGQVQRWAVEGPAPVQLERRGVEPGFLKTGDVVRFCAFALKEEFVTPRLSRGADGVPQRFVHGHVLVRNGQTSMWGSYGKLGECIRTSDEPRQSWVDFLNADPRIGEIWCTQRRNSKQATPAMRAFVEEIHTLLRTPCE